MVLLFSGRKLRPKICGLGLMLKVQQLRLEATTAITRSDPDNDGVLISSVATDRASTSFTLDAPFVDMGSHSGSALGFLFSENVIDLTIRIRSGRRLAYGNWMAGTGTQLGQWDLTFILGASTATLAIEDADHINLGEKTLTIIESDASNIISDGLNSQITTSLFTWIKEGLVSGEAEDFPATFRTTFNAPTGGDVDIHLIQDLDTAPATSITFEVHPWMVASSVNELTIELKDEAPFAADDGTPTASYVDGSGVALTGTPLTTARGKTIELLGAIILTLGAGEGVFGPDGSEYLLDGDFVYRLTITDDLDQIIYPWMIAEDYTFFIVMNGDGRLVVNLDNLGIDRASSFPATLLSLDINGAGHIAFTSARNFARRAPVWLTGTNLRLNDSAVSFETNSSQNLWAWMDLEDIVVTVRSTNRIRRKGAENRLVDAVVAMRASTSLTLDAPRVELEILTSEYSPAAAFAFSSNVADLTISLIGTGTATYANWSGGTGTQMGQWNLTFSLGADGNFEIANSGHVNVGDKVFSVIETDSGRLSVGSGTGMTQPQITASLFRWVKQVSATASGTFPTTFNVAFSASGSDDFTLHLVYDYATAPAVALSFNVHPWMVGSSVDALIVELANNAGISGDGQRATNAFVDGTGTALIDAALTAVEAKTEFIGFRQTLDFGTDGSIPTERPTATPDGAEVTADERDFRLLTNVDEQQVYQWMIEQGSDTLLIVTAEGGKIVLDLSKIAFGFGATITLEADNVEIIAGADGLSAATLSAIGLAPRAESITLSVSGDHGFTQDMLFGNVDVVFTSTGTVTINEDVDKSEGGSISITGETIIISGGDITLDGEEEIVLSAGAGGYRFRGETATFTASEVTFIGSGRFEVDALLAQVIVNGDVVLSSPADSGGTIVIGTAIVKPLGDLTISGDSASISASITLGGDATLTIIAGSPETLTLGGASVVLTATNIELISDSLFLAETGFSIGAGVESVSFTYSGASNQQLYPWMLFDGSAAISLITTHQSANIAINSSLYEDEQVVVSDNSLTLTSEGGIVNISQYTDLFISASALTIDLGGVISSLNANLTLESTGSDAGDNLSITIGGDIDAKGFDITLIATGIGADIVIAHQTADATVTLVTQGTGRVHLSKGSLFSDDATLYLIGSNVRHLAITVGATESQEVHNWMVRSGRSLALAAQAITLNRAIDLDKANLSLEAEGAITFGEDSFTLEGGAITIASGSEVYPATGDYDFTITALVGDINFNVGDIAWVRGDLILSAKGDIHLDGSSYQSAGDLSITAGGLITIDESANMLFSGKNVTISAADTNRLAFPNRVAGTGNIEIYTTTVSGDTDDVEVTTYDPVTGEFGSATVQVQSAAKITLDGALFKTSGTITIGAATVDINGDAFSPTDSTDPDYDANNLVRMPNIVFATASDLRMEGGSVVINGALETARVDTGGGTRAPAISPRGEHGIYITATGPTNGDITLSQDGLWTKGEIILIAQNRLIIGATNIALRSGKGMTLRQSASAADTAVTGSVTIDAGGGVLNLDIKVNTTSSIAVIAGDIITSDNVELTANTANTIINLAIGGEQRLCATYNITCNVFPSIVINLDDPTLDFSKIPGISIDENGVLRAFSLNNDDIIFQADSSTGLVFGIYFGDEFDDSVSSTPALTKIIAGSVRFRLTSGGTPGPVNLRIPAVSNIEIDAYQGDITFEDEIAFYTQGGGLILNARQGNVVLSHFSLTVAPLAFFPDLTFSVTTPNGQITLGDATITDARVALNNVPDISLTAAQGIKVIVPTSLSNARANVFAEESITLSSPMGVELEADLTITAITNVYLNGNISSETTGADLSISATGTDTNADGAMIVITQNEDFSIQLGQNGNIALQSEGKPSGSNIFQHNITIKAPGMGKITLDGAFSTIGTLTLEAGAFAFAKTAALDVTAGDMILKSLTEFTLASADEGTQDMSFTTTNGDLVVDVNEIKSSGAISFTTTASDNLDVTSSKITTASGAISFTTSNGDLTVDVDQITATASGTISFTTSNGVLDVTSNQITTNSGAISFTTSNGDLNLAGEIDQITTVSGAISFSTPNGDLILAMPSSKITATGSGTIGFTSSGNLDVEIDEITADSGAVRFTSSGDLAVEIATQIKTASGAISLTSTGNLVANIDKIITASGAISLTTTNGDLAVTSSELKATNSGTISLTANGDLAVNSDTITADSGAISLTTTNGDLAVASPQITTSGAISFTSQSGLILGFIKGAEGVADVVTANMVINGGTIAFSSSQAVSDEDSVSAAAKGGLIHIISAGTVSLEANLNTAASILVKAQGSILTSTTNPLIKAGGFFIMDENLSSSPNRTNCAEKGLTCQLDNAIKLNISNAGITMTSPLSISLTITVDGDFVGNTHNIIRFAGKTLTFGDNDVIATITDDDMDLSFWVRAISSQGDITLQGGAGVDSVRYTSTYGSDYLTLRAGGDLTVKDIDIDIRAGTVRNVVTGETEGATAANTPTSLLLEAGGTFTLDDDVTITIAVGSLELDAGAVAIDLGAILIIAFEQTDPESTDLFPAGTAFSPVLTVNGATVSCEDIGLICLTPRGSRPLVIDEVDLADLFSDGDLSLYDLFYDKAMNPTDPGDTDVLITYDADTGTISSEYGFRLTLGADHTLPEDLILINVGGDINIDTNGFTLTLSNFLNLNAGRSITLTGTFDASGMVGKGVSEILAFKSVVFNGVYRGGNGGFDMRLISRHEDVIIDGKITGADDDTALDGNVFIEAREGAVVFAQNKDVTIFAANIETRATSPPAQDQEGKNKVTLTATGNITLGADMNIANKVTLLATDTITLSADMDIQHDIDLTAQTYTSTSATTIAAETMLIILSDEGTRIACADLGATCAPKEAVIDLLESDGTLSARLARLLVADDDDGITPDATSTILNFMDSFVTLANSGGIAPAAATIITEIRATADIGFTDTISFLGSSALTVTTTQGNIILDSDAALTFANGVVFTASGGYIGIKGSATPTTLITSTAGNIVLTSTGIIVEGENDDRMTSDLTLTATAGSVSVASSINLDGDISIAGSIASGDAISVTGALTSGGGILLVATEGNITVSDSITSGRDITLLVLTSGDISASSITSVDNITFETTAGSVNVTGSLTSDGDIMFTVSLGDISVTGAITSNGAITLNAETNITVSSITSDGNITLRAFGSGDISVTGSITSGGAIMLETTTLGDISVTGSITSDRHIMLTTTGTGDISVSSITSTGAITLTAGTGNISVSALTSDGTIALIARAGSITLNGDVSADNLAVYAQPTTDSGAVGIASSDISITVGSTLLLNEDSGSGANAQRILCAERGFTCTLPVITADLTLVNIQPTGVLNKYLIGTVLNIGDQDISLTIPNQAMANDLVALLSGITSQGDITIELTSTDASGSFVDSKVLFSTLAITAGGDISITNGGRDGNADATITILVNCTSANSCVATDPSTYEVAPLSLNAGGDVHVDDVIFALTPITSAISTAEYNAFALTTTDRTHDIVGFDLVINAGGDVRLTDIEFANSLSFTNVATTVTASAVNALVYEITLDNGLDAIAGGDLYLDNVVFDVAFTYTLASGHPDAVADFNVPYRAVVTVFDLTATRGDILLGNLAIVKTGAMEFSAGGQLKIFEGEVSLIADGVGIDLPEIATYFDENNEPANIEGLSLTLESTGAITIAQITSFNAPLNITTHGGNIAINGVLNSDSTITLMTDSGGSITITGALSAQGDVDFTADSYIEVMGDISAPNITFISGSDYITLHGEVTAQEDIKLTATSGNITLMDDVSGRHVSLYARERTSTVVGIANADITINAATLLLEESVSGGATALRILCADRGFTCNLSQATLVFGITQNSLSGRLAEFLMGSILNLGDHSLTATFGENIVFSASLSGITTQGDLILRLPSAITFARLTLDANNIRLEAYPSSTVTISGPMTPDPLLDGFIVNARGNVFMDGDIAITARVDKVEFNVAGSLTQGTGAISLTSTGNSLALTHVGAYVGAFGGSLALQGVTIDLSSAIDMPGGGISLTTIGTDMTDTLAGTTITLGGDLEAGGDITISTASLLTDIPAPTTTNPQDNILAISTTGGAISITSRDVVADANIETRAITITNSAPNQEGHITINGVLNSASDITIKASGRLMFGTTHETSLISASDISLSAGDRTIPTANAAVNQLTLTAGGDIDLATSLRSTAYVVIRAVGVITADSDVANHYIIADILLMAQEVGTDDESRVLCSDLGYQCTIGTITQTSFSAADRSNDFLLDGIYDLGDTSLSLTVASALTFASDLTIQTTGDITLNGEFVTTAGDMAFTAGGSINLATTAATTFTFTRHDTDDLTLDAGLAPNVESTEAVTIGTSATSRPAHFHLKQLY